MSTTHLPPASHGDTPLHRCPPVVQLYDLLLMHGHLCETSEPEFGPIDFGGLRTWQSVETLAAVFAEFSTLQSAAQQQEALPSGFTVTVA